MSKEINDALDIVKVGGVGHTLEEYEKSLSIIKNALTRLEAIDNAKPSKALECLVKNRTAIPFKGQYDTIKQALTTKSKKELAWEIAREYKVDLWLVSQCDYENYLRIRKEATVENEMIASDSSDNVEDIIPRDMFELLKEVLE